jgi:hypothetical protein
MALKNFLFLILVLLGAWFYYDRYYKKDGVKHTNHTTRGLVSPFDKNGAISDPDTIAALSSFKTDTQQSANVLLAALPTTPPFTRHRLVEDYVAGHRGLFDSLRDDDKHLMNRLAYLLHDIQTDRNNRVNSIENLYNRESKLQSDNFEKQREFLITNITREWQNYSAEKKTEINALIRRFE